MNNKFLQTTIRFIKENNLYNKNDEKQRLALIKLKTSLRKQKNEYVVGILYNECLRNIFHGKKTIGDFESFLFIHLFNKTQTEILDEYLINNGLYGLFYKAIKTANNTIDLTYGVGKTIFVSFCWDDTKEGIAFWGEEDKKLKKYINNIISEKIQ